MTERDPILPNRRGFLPALFAPVLRPVRLRCLPAPMQNFAAPVLDLTYRTTPPRPTAVIDAVSRVIRSASMKALTVALLFAAPALAQPPGGIFVTLPSSPEKTAAALRAHAARSQVNVRRLLDARGAVYTAFWITNEVYVPLADLVTREALTRAGFSFRAERVFSIPRPQPGRERPRVRGVEWGIAMTQAPNLHAQGVTGKGVVVASIDTGVSADHPALKGKIAAWSDPSGVCKGAGPCDNNGHGTHTIGTMIGSGGVGMAPDAKVAACKGCESSSCSESNLTACAQWVLEVKPKPAAVNNSWGGPGNDPWFRAIVQAWRAAGVFPAFAAGNDGAFGCGSINSPGDYPESVGVAAVDSKEAIAGFSSRGPGKIQAQKPDVAAPGVDVRSSCTGQAYCTFSGTSMATPHVAGAVALLAQRAGGDLDRIVTALKSTATPRPAPFSCGETPPQNFAFGAGVINVAAAYNSLPDTPPPPPPPPPPPDNTLPSLTILSPPNMARYPCGEPIPLQGRATDAEDGDLSAQIVWRHLYYGWRGAEGEFIGPGGAGCELGWHWVTAEVTDSRAAKVEETVMVEIVPAAPLKARGAAASSQGTRTLTPVSGWWGDCRLDLDAIGDRLSKAAKKWTPSFAR